MASEEQRSDKPIAPPEERYNALFEAQSKSSTLRRIWAEVYGEDYPVDADPMSFVTVTDLAWFVRELRVGPGHTFADLGCGRGGPGLWVLQKTGASLIGIDLSTVAVQHAQGRVKYTALQSRARYQHGTFAHTDLETASMDGAMSAEALFFAPDRQAACHEIARILKPGARFAMSSYEFHQRSPIMNVEAIPDYRPLLEQAGFVVKVYKEAPNWEARLRAVFAGIVAEKDRLAEEMGEAVASRLHDWASHRPHELSDTRRILAVAQR
jgi:ubiquinone/menaquinone biosynthesis C-methylase UbiE